MKGIPSLIVGLLLCYSSSGQTFSTDHKHHLDLLTSAKDSLYENTLKAYDLYLRQHPADISAALERCKFIEAAYYDSYEDYNPNLEKARACGDTLIKKFPGNPEVLLYPTEFLYGDSLIAYLKDLEALMEANTKTWQPYRWEVYKSLAENYSHDDDDLTIHYGELATTNNDTLDLSLILAQAYKNSSNDQLAIDVLVSNLDSTDVPWVLNQKGKLLLDLGVPDKAIEAFSIARKKNEFHEDAGSLAQALIDNGLLTEGRTYLLKDYQSSTAWNTTRTVRALLNYDLKYGSADSARLNYDRLTHDNFSADALGVYRLRLLFKDPFIGWSLADIGKVLLLILVLGMGLIVPYVWILPIHYFGIYQKNRGKIFEGATFHWDLRHFWMASSAWIICTILGDLIFYYHELLLWFDNSGYVEQTSEISVEYVNATLLFFVGLLVFSIAMLRIEDIAQVIPKIKRNFEAIGVGIGLAFVLKFGLAIYSGLLKMAGVDLQSTASGMASVSDVIKAIINHYNPMLGFLFVAIFVPFYEEILFRGIFLSSCSRHMKFMAANVIQSLVFALVHQDLKFFIFYFAFGMVAGHFTRKSGSLITSTSMHMMNNLMAFIYILSAK